MGAKALVRSTEFSERARAGKLDQAQRCGRSCDVYRRRWSDFSSASPRPGRQRCRQTSSDVGVAVNPAAASDAVDVSTGPVPAGAATSTPCAGARSAATKTQQTRTDQQKEGHGEPGGVRLTARTDSEGENPKDGAGMEKARRVTKAGVRRCESASKRATPKGRRLNKPLSTESKRTLGVERSLRRVWRPLWSTSCSPQSPGRQRPVGNGQPEQPVGNDQRQRLRETSGQADEDPSGRESLGHRTIEGAKNLRKGRRSGCKSGHNRLGPCNPGTRK